MGSVSVFNVKKLEKVSCICVTRNRSDFLLKSIKCFESQNYTDKELIIVYYKDDLKTKDIALSNKNPEVFFYEYDPSEGLSLGGVRNKALSHTTGKYVCVWDDDDWYGHDRITKQFCYILNSEKDASILSHLTVYDYETDEIMLTANRPEGWEGSLMCKREVIMKHQYGDMDKSEDTYLLERLIKDDCIKSFKDPCLYVYFFHTQNTSSRSHLNNIKSESEELSQYEELIIRKKIKNYIEDYVESRKVKS